VENISFFTVLGLYLHIYVPVIVKFCKGQLTVQTFTFIGAACRTCGAKNPFLDNMSTRNTGMAALRASLSVTNKKHHTFSSTAGVRLTSLMKLPMVIEEVRPIFAPHPLSFLIPSLV